MSKNRWTKIMAFLALFWIIISLIWTWLLVIFWDNQNTNNWKNLTPEQIKQIQNMIKSWTWIKVSTWETTSTWNLKITWSWETN